MASPGWNSAAPTITAKLTPTGVEIGSIADLEHTPFRRQQEANARLIAAAPDLLASLKELVGMVEEMLPNAGPCGWGTLAIDNAKEIITSCGE